MGRVVSVLRYPLKSARGEDLEEADLDPDGLRGDRSWACLDAADGTVVSAKHPSLWGRMLGVRASLADADEVAIDVGGTVVLAGTEQADAALSRHLGREVRLSRVVPEGAKLHRLLPDEAGLVPEWMAGSAPGQAMVTPVAGARPGGRFVDYGAVHLLTTGALSGLGLDGADAVRFRPNLVVEAPHDPEPGHELRLGDAVLRVLVPTPRCAVPGLAQGDLPADRALLGALARRDRVLVAGFGRAACFGTYAEVLHPGRVRVGQAVRDA